MNDKRTALLPASYPPTNDHTGLDAPTHTKFSLYYFKGRGYAFTTDPTEVGERFEKIALFDSRATRTLVEPTRRFSQKRYDALADRLFRPELLETLNAALMTGNKAGVEVLLKAAAA